MPYGWINKTEDVIKSTSQYYQSGYWWNSVFVDMFLPHKLGSC